MSAHGVKVLLIEDKLSDVRVIERLLSKSTEPSFEIEISDRVGAGLEYLSSGVGPDVILLDLSLPDSSPEKLDSFHRIHHAAPGIPIIIMTGMGDQAIATRAVRHGAQDFLIKGEVGSDVLLRSIRYAIERQQAEEELRESEERYALAVRVVPMTAYGTGISRPTRFISRHAGRPFWATGNRSSRVTRESGCNACIRMI